MSPSSIEEKNGEQPQASLGQKAPIFRTLRPRFQQPLLLLFEESLLPALFQGKEFLTLQPCPVGIDDTL